jgi:hypothetical protein
MPASPATRAKKPKGRLDARTEFDDIVVLSRDDEAETFEAKIFGTDDVFTFSMDLNAYLQLAAFSGAAGAFVDFMDSLVVVNTDGDDDRRAVERKRRDEAERFHDLLKNTSHLTVERLAQFVADITEIAGDRPTNSSSG